MNRIERIRNVERDELATQHFHAVFASVGFEQRARHVADVIRPNADRFFACGFLDRQVLAYAENRRCFEANGYSIAEVRETAFSKWCRDSLLQLPVNSEKRLNLCVDISSMSRYRIASVLAAIGDLNAWETVNVSFLYANAGYSPPTRELGQVENAGPVLRRFAGWSNEPDRPITAIFGLGYEYDKAIGALDYIEPAEVWAFQLKSTDPRYDDETEKANRFLWPVLPEERRITYRIERPLDCLTDLESLTSGLLRATRPVLVPFGPKIFTLHCLLVACIHFPRVAVWRVTTGVNAPPADRVPDGLVTGIEVQFRVTEG